jgi:hypothetical protein
MKEGDVIRDQTLPHFITATVVNWVDVFTRKAFKDNIKGLVRFYLKNQFYIIFPFNITRKQAISLRSFSLFRSAAPVSQPYFFIRALLVDKHFITSVR